MSPRARRAPPPPPRRRTTPVYRDVRVYYAPADAKRQQLTENEQKQLQRRALEEAGRTAVAIAARAPAAGRECDTDAPRRRARTRLSPAL
jgi:hypothetical protein